MKLFNQMCFTDRDYVPSVDPSPEALGTIWTDDFTGANLANYTNAGSSGIALNTGSDRLDFSGSFNNFVKHLQFSKSDNPHHHTMLEKWTQRLVVNTPASLTGAFGFGVGIRSTSTYSGNDFHVIGRWAWDENNVYFYQDDVIGGTQVIKSTGFTVVANTTYIVYMTRNKNTYTYVVKDATDTTTHFTCTYNTMLTTTAGVNNFGANAGRFCLWNFQGNFWISDWTITSTSQKNIDVACIGASNEAGRYAGAEATRYCEQAFTTLGLSFEILAGSGDRGTEVLLYLDEVIELNPTKVYLNIGSNDVASGQSSGTWQANLDSIISTLEGAGITVVLGTPVARNSNNLTIVQTYMNGLGKQVIDIFELTRSGTNLNGTYNIGDDTHMNATGNNVCADEVEAEW